MLQEGVGSGTGPSVAAVRALVNQHLGPGIVMDTTQAIAHIRVPSHLELSMPALLSALKVRCLFSSQKYVFLTEFTVAYKSVYKSAYKSPPKDTLVSKMYSSGEPAL